MVVLNRNIIGLLCGGNEHAKIKILKPKYFDGIRGAKELKNFLQDLEDYFATAQCPKLTN